jgi:hypothetical protein
MKRNVVLFLLLLCTIGLSGQGFYDIGTINTIEITFEEANWDQILDQLVSEGNEEYHMGSVTINGQVFDSVGVRYKGNSSYNANNVKNPLNIKLDYLIDNQLLQGFGTLKLANGFKDPTFVRETMSYEIARKYFSAGLSNYAEVYINGTHIGLYTNDQDMDKYFMRTSFGSDENLCVKGEIGSGMPPGEMGGVWQYFGSDSTDYFPYYALESDYGWNELVAFLDTLNNHNDQLDNVLNIDRHLWFLAFENLLVNLDGPINNPQNYYIYKDDDGRINPMPWDLNESFGVFTMLQSEGPQTIQKLQRLDPFVNLGNNDYPIISRVLDQPRYRKWYVAHMKTMMSENFSNGWYHERALELQAVIDAAVQADQNKFFSYANFISNVTSPVGGGPNQIVGITQLMETRISYLNALPDFQYEAPVISTLGYFVEDAGPGRMIWFTIETENATEAEVFYRFTDFGRYHGLQLYDDGEHNDGEAGDGLFGGSLNTLNAEVHYYVVAENENAAAFSPARSASSFYTIGFVSDVVINEFMADNESTVADQDGDYDDWIELYNNSLDPLNLGGYYLSDDASEPDQWMFPDTVLQPGEYLIVWADEDEDQAGLHANFKLSASGETLMLSDTLLALLNQVTFGPQKPDTTTGRYPNGVGDFALMLPTFEAQNNEGLVGLYDDEAELTPAGLLAQNYPNPFSRSTTIRFDLEKESEISLRVMNLFGQTLTILATGTVAAGRHEYLWDARDMPAGLYFYRLQAGRQVFVGKMMLK